MSNLAEQITDLHNMLDSDLIDPKSQGFAESLVKQYTKYKKLSDKQVYWVGKLIERAMFGDAKPEPEKQELGGSFGGMIDLFNKAKQHLKFPKINLQTEAGQPVQLSVAGAKAKKPGSINVTDGGPFGDNLWFGRILTDGSWEKSAKGDREVGKLLQAFAENPVKVAADHGKLTGHCCFCNKKLTTEESTAVGYGPVCATNYGLPWGK